MDALSPDQQEQVRRLAEDISFVRKAIERNTSILRQLDFRQSLRRVTLLTALSIFFFCGLFHVAMKQYGGFHILPTSIKAILFGAIALVAAALGFLKNRGMLSSARSLEPTITLLHLIREYYSIKLFHHFIPMGLALIFACVYAAATGNPRLIIPMLSIGAGLLYNSFDVLLRIDEFLLTGYWFIVSGCIVLVYNTVSPLLSLSLTIGCGLLLLSALWYMPHKKQEER